MKEYDEVIPINQGSLWEEEGLDLCLNYLLFKDHAPGGTPPCPHSKYMETFHFAGGIHDATWAENAYIVPRVIIAYNEGGHATTGVCLDCLSEVADGLR
jgi:hypothetical protein